MRSASTDQNVMNTLIPYILSYIAAENAILIIITLPSLYFILSVFNLHALIIICFYYSFVVAITNHPIQISHDINGLNEFGQVLKVRFAPSFHCFAKHERTFSQHFIPYSKIEMRKYPLC